jgi:nucleoprotein TPR
LENLQEVIKYLRREKEIVDVQYELSVQEAKRLKQQLDYAQSQLDETRLRLDQQRRAQGESERSALNHNKLMDTINELNLFRESSVTLRNEARQAQASLAEKTERVEELLEQIQPLQTKVRELENQGDPRRGDAAAPGRP